MEGTFVSGPLAENRVVWLKTVSSGKICSSSGLNVAADQSYGISEISFSHSSLRVSRSTSISENSTDTTRTPGLGPSCNGWE